VLFGCVVIVDSADRRICLLGRHSHPWRVGFGLCRADPLGAPTNFHATQEVGQHRSTLSNKIPFGPPAGRPRMTICSTNEVPDIDSLSISGLLFGCRFASDTR